MADCYCYLLLRTIAVVVVAFVDNYLQKMQYFMANKTISSVYYCIVVTLTYFDADLMMKTSISTDVVVVVTVTSTVIAT